MPYQKHDVNNDPVNPGTLLDRNAYERYDESNVIESPQPASTTETDDYSNQFKNWNADYSPHGPNGEDLNPDVPINIDTDATLTGNTSTGVRRTEDVTGNIAVFSGGNGALTVEGRFFVGDLTRDDLSGWEPLTEYSTDAVQTYTTQASDVGRRIIFATRATDAQGTVAISIASDIVRVYERVTATSQTTYSGIKKVGSTLNVYTATGTGGIPPLNYLIQLRFSDTGTGNWGSNQNLATNLAAGERVDYTIPAEQAGRYIQIRTRIRDNNGTGGSGVYQQIWSIAPDSTLQIAAPLTEGSGFGVALNGEFRVGQEIAVASIPAFEGGAPTVKYEYQWQKSLDGTSWVGFDSPWTEYDPTTIRIDNPSKSLNASEIGYLIRVQARATDAAGQQLIVPGEVYGPVVSEEPEVVTATLVSAPLIGPLDRSYRVGDSVNITKATFTGGASPYASITVRLYSGFTRAQETLQEWVGAETDGAMIFELKHIHEDLFLYAETVVVDAVGNETISPIVLHDNARGVLPYEPELELVSPTEDYGLATPGNTVRVRCAEYSGGVAPQVYDVLLRESDTFGGAYTQTTIQANATPGQLYGVPITSAHLNKYLTFVTRVGDNGRDDATGFKQKFSIHQLDYKVIVPSTPTPSGPQYDYNGYDLELYVEPNYKQGHILRVGDTITMTVPEFFGGEAPYRFDLNSWHILDKANGVEVFASPNNQPPGSSLTYTIPQSLQGHYIKVNYYFYDRLLTRFKFEMKLYSGDNPQASSGLIMSAV